ncbi:DUF7260 family protein [Halorhabdus amylolytica]|uniref:DUF7260 family protein n=1 Tax=Halorhabdus amylolytica TaxID=2559573 RepID=UPI0010AA6F76|nr:hypothetical protein [Halorhabdus amylolytica]
MTETTQPTIERALTRAQRECELLDTERDAFRTLLTRVSRIQVDGPGPTTVRTGGSTTVVRSVASQSSRRLQKLRTAYRETVMGVVHYDSEYGESLRENLAAECGHPLARQIVDGETLVPTVYNAFVDACKRARDERSRLCQYVERERDSLGRYAERLDGIETTAVEVGSRIDSTSETESLSRIDRTLERLESRCADLATERQEQIHGRSVADVDGTELELLEYLYDDMETTTPVLADVAACLETIRYHRNRCQG